MQIYSTEENNMQNAHERVASKSCHKTAQVKATKINDRNQTDSNSPQNLENQIGGEKVQSNGNDSPSSIHHFSMQSLERNSCLTREKMAPEKERKRKVKVPTENIENDTLDYLMQTVVKTEQPESVETQAPHGANALISKSIQLDDKEDKPLENDNKHSIRMQICQQDSVCLPELSEIQSCKIPIGDAVNNKEHNPMIKNNSTRPKGIKEKKRRTSSVVRAPRSKKVGSELKFKNAGKSTTPARKLGALKELNVPRNFEIFRETMETVVPNDVLISNNLKLFHSVKNVSKVDCEINCNSKKVSPKVGNRLAIEQNAMMPQSQTKNENHPTPSRETNHNSFIANQSLSPCVVHLVEEIVECDVDPKQCNKKDSMPVKKKSVKHKKNNRYSNIIKENVKPQSIKTLEKDKILTIADVHEPPDENINCEKNALANMQPSVVLNDILGGSQFSMLKKGLNENRKISPSHELPVPLNEKNSRRKILHEEFLYSAVEPRGIPSRRTRKPVNYKEPSVHLKLRRT
ncbi:uncharacterized protein LOC129217548 isoform X2 [Uloborus diversus]|uniref:uncharacterized protein LOC129217548 isoform X2 n=1 Tax=Uloborus diversus TaxID=327109 RepID=UPI00240921AF|nr:uncharacterized protein LOC129217548 isoform X2 [Uloborus diversus]